MCSHPLLTAVGSAIAIGGASICCISGIQVCCPGITVIKTADVAQCISFSTMMTTMHHLK